MENTEEVENAAETTENVLTQEIENEKTLKCSVCNLYISDPNVVMTTQDDVKQYKCTRCSIKKITLIDLSSYKGFTKNMKFPCTYNDCTEIIDWDNVRDHKMECAYRTLKCIASDCQEDEVLHKNFAAHFKEKHEKLYHSEKIVLENIHSGGGMCVLENGGKCYVFFYDTDIDTFRMCLCGIQAIDKQFEMVFKAKDKKNSRVFNAEDNKNSIVSTEHKIVFYDNQLHCYKCLKGDCKFKHHMYCHYGKDMLRDTNGKIQKDLLKRTFGNDVTCIINVVDQKVKNENDDELNDLLTGKDVIDEVTEDEKPTVPSKTDAIKELLKCPGCEQQLSEPIFQCLQGHAVCKDCKIKTEDAKCSSCETKIENTRNYIIEEAIADLRLNKQKGAEDKEVTCPMSTCHEMVKLSGISNHYKESHIENFHINKAALKNVHGYYNVDVLVKNGKTYLLFFDFDDLYFGISVSSLDGEEEFYEVKLLSDDKKLSFIANDQNIIKYNDKEHAYSPIDPQKRKLVHQQLILLLHAHKCQKQAFPFSASGSGEVSSCTLPHCKTMKNVLDHLKTCNAGQSCSVTHCRSSRHIISHWKYCFCLSLPNNPTPDYGPDIQLSGPNPTGLIRNPVQLRPALPLTPIDENVLRNITIQGTCVLASAGPVAPNISLSLIIDPSNSAETQKINQKAAAASTEQSVNNNVSGAEAFNRELENQLSTGLQPDQVTTVPGTGTKEWHQHVTPDFRDQFVHKLIEAVFPTDHPEALLNKTMYKLVTFAKEVEGNLYKTANSRSEYCHLVAMKLCYLKQELKAKLLKRNELQLRLRHSSGQKEQTLPQNRSDIQDTDQTSNDASECEMKENFRHLTTTLNIDCIRRGFKSSTLIYQINIKETKEDQINKIIKKWFECPICEEYMAPPIHQCVAGHTLCNVCKSKVKKCPFCECNIEETRNFILENISDTVEFPFSFEAKGCTFKGGVKRVASHELECPLNNKTPCVNSTADAKEAKGNNSKESAANAEEANSTSQEGTDKSQEGTDKSQEGTDKSQKGTDKSREKPDNSQGGTEKSQEGTDKSQEKPDNSQKGTDKSQEGTDKSQEETDNSQEGMDNSQEATTNSTD